MASEATNLRAALFLGADDGPHRLLLAKRARETGASIVVVFQCDSAGEGPLQRERLVVAAHDCKFDLVILPRIALLGADTLEVLGVLSQLAELRIAVQSLDEPWVSAAEGTLPLLYRWMRDEASKRQKEGRKAGLARARLLGRQIGRPRVAVPAEAFEAVEAGRRIAEVGRAFGVAPSTLRRALAQRSTIETGLPALRLAHG